ncbi:MAG: hypothetical protein QF886_23255, partial [Planctomycetota bacterium]|nr:hypothetical protein [Planctomycetota bacterium]
MPETAQDILWLSERIKLLPVIHGSGDFALAVREEMLAHKWDCLAVPLPPSFKEQVEEGIDRLPSISMVTMEEPIPFDPGKLVGEEEEEDNT